MRSVRVKASQAPGTASLLIAVCSCSSSIQEGMRHPLAATIRNNRQRHSRRPRRSQPQDRSINCEGSIEGLARRLCSETLAKTSIAPRQIRTKGTSCLLWCRTPLARFRLLAYSLPKQQRRERSRAFGARAYTPKTGQRCAQRSGSTDDSFNFLSVLLLSFAFKEFGALLLVFFPTAPRTANRFSHSFNHAKNPEPQYCTRPTYIHITPSNPPAAAAGRRSRP